MQPDAAAERIPVTSSSDRPVQAPRIVAHRGGAGERPQNTLSAFRACVGSGIDGVEFDVHGAADGRLVIHHDAWLDRSTDGRGAIADQTSEALAAVRVRGSEEGVPALDDALDVLGADAALELHLEIKSDHRGLVRDGLIRRCLEAVEMRGLLDRLVLTSFRAEDLEVAVALRPGLATALAIQLSTSWMVGGLEALVGRALDIPGSVISLESQLARHSLDRLLDLAPNRLGVWNADDEGDLCFWLKQPIRQIITDHPTLALRLKGA